MNAVSAMKKVEEHAAKICNNDPIIYERFDVGCVHWQGDVGILRISDVPSGATVSKNKNPQLAPGTSKGSRHIIADSDLSSIVMYEIKNPNALQGAVIKCKKDVEITHPEHGNVTIPKGIYSIVYQRAYADELLRVED